ncbi:hypothetical protein rosag_20250 [Roseisolibacter agri]|uniref:DUF937 domain-containing protein n=2 Tax=Roseisolibacter agri TaxID=2014610 RepID=A0AA37V2N8_9BACT|nr:hypothetical protein rosag_20250 [Roseisolibacter agri]
MLGGMAAGTREPEGANALAGVLGGGGLGGILGGMLGGGGHAAGAGGGMGGMDLGGVLGSILGRSQPAVQDGVQQASGLNSDQTRKLLMILAPIVLAAIMKSRQGRTADGAVASGGGLGIPGMGGGMGGGTGIPGMGGAQRPADASMVDSDGDGIPDYLEQEARTAEARAAQRNPKIGGILGKILDMAQRPPR